MTASFAEVQWFWKAHSGQTLEGEQEHCGEEEEGREPDLINSYIICICQSTQKPRAPRSGTKGNSCILTCPGFTRESLLAFQLSGFPAL